MTGTPLPPACPNCGAALHGRFCAACGQDCGYLRLDTRSMLAEGVRQLAGWDGALIRTLKGLLIDPGGLSRDYVQGRRRSHLNPARFCLVSLGLWLVLIKLLGFEVLDTAGIRFTSNSTDPCALAEKIRAFMTRHFDSLLFATLPIRAWIMRLTFRRSNASVAECLVQVLYVSGFGFLVGALLVTMDAAGLHGVYKARPFIALIWAIRAARGYFRTSWLEAIAKIFLVLIAHMLATGLLVALVVLLWVRW